MPTAWQDVQNRQNAGLRNYYVPMADLLAGLVFILIIVLQAVALVAREDFARADDVMRETRRIEERLERLRAIDREAIQPREQTEASLRSVVEAIVRDLVVAGIPATVEREGRWVAIRGLSLVTAEGLAPALPRAADAIGTTLQRWLPCLQAERPASCPGLVPVQATQIRIDAMTSRGPAAAAAAGAALNADIAVRHPGLAVRGGPDGAPLVAFRGLVAAEDGIEIAFQIQRAPVPADIVIIGPR
jgi:hypothetical protein